MKISKHSMESIDKKTDEFEQNSLSKKKIPKDNMEKIQG